MVRGFIFRGEQNRIIVDALVFTKEKILRHYEDMSDTAPQVSHPEIDLERQKEQDEIDEVLKIIANEDLSIVRGVQKKNRFYSIIKSALKIYNLEYQKAKDKPIPSIRKKLENIEEINIDHRLRERKSDLYDKLSIKNERSIYEDLTVKIFISYSSLDNKTAGFLKEILEGFSFDVFLAHEDIEPSKEWQEVIQNSLDECDVFIPLVSVNFKKSNWTDQESGIALAKNKLLIPINLGLNPYGFLGNTQALKLDRIIDNTGYKIFEIIKNSSPLGVRMRNNVIISLIGSSDFKEANERAPVILDWEPYSKTQLDEIIRAFIINPQIHGAYNAQDVIEIIVERHYSQIDSTLIREFNEILASVERR